MGYHLLAFLLSLLLPLTLFVSRSVIRRERSAVYVDVMRNLFPENNLPQLDLIGAKYGAPPTGGEEAGTDRRLPRQKRQSLAIYLASALFAALTFAGFELLFVPIVQMMVAADADVPRWSMPVQEAFFWTTGEGDKAMFHNTVAVVAIAFLGSYVASARFLVRQALNYELDGLSFVRCVLLVIMGMSIAMVTYRALAPTGDGVAGFFAGSEKPPATGTANKPGGADPASPPPPPSPGSPDAGGQTPGGGPTKGGSSATPAGDTPPDRSAGWWLALAFMLGYAPEAGLSWMARRARINLQKDIDTDLLGQVRVVPVEVIDGIDSQIAYQLERINIEDVQNLAMANPIQLYIETPYGMFEVFDWVLQAQLCLVTGPRAFLALKQHGVRTIFDFERAVLADGVPDAYVQAIGEVVFAKADPKFRALIATKDGPLTADLVRHAVAVSGDDLHVHRLRTLWLRIRSRSWPGHKGEWIYRRSPLPGDEGYGLPQGEGDGLFETARLWGRMHAAATSEDVGAARRESYRGWSFEAAERLVELYPAFRSRLSEAMQPGVDGVGAGDLASFAEDPDFKKLLGE